MKTGPKPVPLARRLMGKFLVGDACWEWTANMGKGRGQYGQIYVAPGQYGLAHRVVYELLVGPIPDGLQLDHLCRNTKCVRPDHLEPVTNKENGRRGLAVQKTKERFAKQTQCLRGHQLPAPGPNGKRRCATCTRFRARRYYQSKKEGGSCAVG